MIFRSNLVVQRHSQISISNLDIYDKIILSPGPSLPKDYPIIKDILDVYSYTKPILGICLGHQAICEYFGGEIFHIGQVVHGERSQIDCDSKSLLFRGFSKFIVGRYHSWAVSNLPKELKIVAKDSNGIIMGVEHVNRRIYGVQFHPESYITINGASILKNFIYDI